MPRRANISAAILGIAVLGCGGGATVQHVGPEDMLARAERSLEKGNELAAIETLTQITVDYPGVAFIDRVVFLLGKARLEAHEFSEAEVEFRRVEHDYPFSEYADDALYLVGECYFRQRGTPQLDPTLAETAVERFEYFLKEYPDSPLASEARQRILALREFLAEKLLLNAEQYFRHHRYKAVEIYVNAMLEKYGDTGVVPDGLLLLARARDKLNDRAGACEALSRLEGQPGVGTNDARRATAARYRAEWGCGAPRVEGAVQSSAGG